MKWYKHYIGSARDPVIYEAWSKFGPLAYAVFHIILELMGDNFNPENVGEINLSWTQINFEMRSYRKRVEKILMFYQDKGKFIVKIEGDNVTIKCPKFEELTDNYTKRLLIEKYEQTTNKLHTGVRRDYSINRIDKNRKNSSSSNVPNGTEEKWDDVDWITSREKDTPTDAAIAQKEHGASLLRKLSKSVSDKLSKWRK